MRLSRQDLRKQHRPLVLVPPRSSLSDARINVSGFLPVHGVTRATPFPPPSVLRVDGPLCAHGGRVGTCTRAEEGERVQRSANILCLRVCRADQERAGEREREIGRQLYTASIEGGEKRSHLRGEGDEKVHRGTTNTENNGISNRYVYVHIDLHIVTHVRASMWPVCTGLTLR